MCCCKFSLKTVVMHTFQAKCSRYGRLLTGEFFWRFLFPPWLGRTGGRGGYYMLPAWAHIIESVTKNGCDLTVLHSLWVFIMKRRRKAAPFAFTSSCIRWCALGLWLLLSWLGLMDLLWRLALNVLSPLALVVGQFSILRGCRCLLSLFHFEEHRWGRTVLHGPKLTDRKDSFGSSAS